MNGLYSLRRADRSVKLGAVLFLVGLGAAYVFAFLMVRTYAGLTPGAVAATYGPQSPESVASAPGSGSVETHAIDLTTMAEEPHRVDTALLIQDSHVHLLLYAIVAALETLIVLGLEWPPWLRDTIIAGAFGSGLLDFAGQWLMKFGFGAFSLLTIGAGWAMAVVYAAVVVGTVAAMAGRGPAHEDRDRRENR